MCQTHAHTMLQCDVHDCGRHMELSGDNIAMPLRMIEIYTDPKTYSDAAVDVVYTVMQHLVRHGECHPVALQYE